MSVGNMKSKFEKSLGQIRYKVGPAKTIESDRS